MFSIIVPSYNRKEEVPLLLADLEKQTAQNFEVIIVDDCSKQPVTLDRTYAFPVKIIRNEQNQGAAESRNIGAKDASREWLLFLDDDDRFAEQKCEVLAKAIQAEPQVNFIYHPAECLMVNEGFTYFTHPYSNPQDLTLDNILQANKVGGMPMIGIKKTLFFKVGGLSTDLLSLEDYDFILKVISDADFMPKYIDQALSKCAFHTKRSSVSTNTKNTEKAIRMIYAKYVKTPQQAHNFVFNSFYMLAYPYMMNLSRNAAIYYFKMFKHSKKLKYLIIALITFISPKLAINMKRFI
ncbi:glycosyltransferase family 2 protein [Glaesserella sp.]|uniref:glycosyltransferase family 2 protein n=1 Tax=Glaesserella sp. TaxID=2094731 RepID=UPI0035A17F73